MNYKHESEIRNGKISIRNFLPKLGIERVKDEIYKGLQAQRKTISSKFFYDETGSKLFEQITYLPEYYPTRTEKQILSSLPLGFIKSWDDLHIVEIGSGDHSKISLLMEKIPEVHHPKVTYMPIDISASAIEYAGMDLQRLFPEMNIRGIVADFMMQLDTIPVKQNMVVCFFGSTIGNFLPDEVDSFLQNVSDILLPDNYFLVGFDAVKEVEILENAYNDQQGITAQFNLNILNVINKLAELDFELSDFKHISFFNAEHSRIEMHLEALKDVVVNNHDNSFSVKISKGERLHTENSYKFNDQMITELTKKSGFEVEKIFTDQNHWFNFALLKKK